jgi:hypothetical protein
MDINLYINVENVTSSVMFFCNLLNLFVLQHNDEDSHEAVISYCDSTELKVIIRASTLVSHTSPFLLSVQVANCQVLFNTIKNNQAIDSEWKLSKEFFGTYLSSPVGDQFAIRNNLNTGILFYDKR